MFSSLYSSAVNPFDAIVDKATDEGLTSESWDTNLTICDKVSLEGEQGARQVTTSIQKRFLHRNANVQLYALTLTDALVSNCGAPLHREISSSSFTESLKRLVTERNSHAKVKKRAASLIKKWAQEFERDDKLGIMNDAYHALLLKGISFNDASDQPARPNREQEENALARMEEENIQRAIRESEMEADRAKARQSTSAAPKTQTQAQSNGDLYNTGYVPAASSSKPLPSNPAPEPTPPAPQASGPTISRARALYDFDPDPNQPGELPLRKGDVVRILDRTYAEWWKGECHNRVGIFPVNWVQVLADPTPDEIWKESQMEANVFAQVGNVDRLLAMLQAVEEKGEITRIGDDDEITDLYQKCLTLRPKVLKLLDKYTQKKNEFLDLNAKFVEAKRTYEGMLDEAWSRQHEPQNMHQGYGQNPLQPFVPPPQQPGPTQQAPSYDPVNTMHPGQQSQPQYYAAPVQQGQPVHQYSDPNAHIHSSQQNVQQSIQHHPSQSPPLPQQAMLARNDSYGQHLPGAFPPQSAPVVQVSSPSPTEAFQPQYASQQPLQNYLPHAVSQMHINDAGGQYQQQQQYPQQQQSYQHPVAGQQQQIL